MDGADDKNVRSTNEGNVGPGGLLLSDGPAVSSTLGDQSGTSSGVNPTYHETDVFSEKIPLEQQQNLEHIKEQIDTLPTQPEKSSTKK
ncbi:unnamed protein product [Didymodactylos carnosus]|uniref:Uncharacterized protein n=1 Tax=Didymodactylos carnosus TaxID=1234261 RepID=A0A814IT67_9BILA|nr:unnamed protein product [Didymodactylos carnosus]CAF1531899.1 unnamed protein product [Didymodactylos carnosus]CAF3799695.1 unnamed protein product [Didymodactylos carnosus]CAF4319122.1 unnamed protein product [Didymodactylos carnosus]